MSATPVGPILVVESDRQLGEMLTEQLLADGFSVELARTAEHARILAAGSAPKLALLGRLDSPHGALELLREIRASSPPSATWERSLPAIVVGAQASELDALRAFEAGADDFVSRRAAATYLELRARLQAVLRRTEVSHGNPRTIEIDSLLIDTNAREVNVAGRRVELRHMEFELLAHLAREPQRVFTKAELLRAVWAYRCGGMTRTVDSHASRLRRKLAPDDPGRWVISVRSVGYRLI